MLVDCLLNLSNVDLSFVLFCSNGCLNIFFVFKQKTAYDMRISDWSSDVCSSDLTQRRGRHAGDGGADGIVIRHFVFAAPAVEAEINRGQPPLAGNKDRPGIAQPDIAERDQVDPGPRTL